MTDIGGVSSKATIGVNYLTGSDFIQKGMLNGRSFNVVQSSTFNLLDAAEELTFVANLFKGKSLKKRKMTSDKKLSSSIQERIKKIQTIENVQLVKDFLNKLSSKSSLSESYLKGELESFSDDPVDQFALLSIAKKHFEEQKNDQTLSVINKVRDEVHKKHQTLIQVGENVSEEAIIYKQLGSVRQIREDYAGIVNKYVDHIRDDETLQKLYQFLVDKYGTDNLEEATSMQLSLLSVDMSKLTPSAAQEHLTAIINDLSQLKQLIAIHEDCIEAESQLIRTYPEVLLKEKELINQLLGMVQQQWVTESDFDKIPDSMNVDLLNAQIFLLTKVVSIIRMISEDVFMNDEIKQSILLAATESLNSKIELEEGEEQSFFDKGIVEDIDIDLLK